MSKNQTEDTGGLAGGQAGGQCRGQNGHCFVAGVIWMCETGKTRIATAKGCYKLYAKTSLEKLNTMRVNQTDEKKAGCCLMQLNRCVPRCILQ